MGFHNPRSTASFPHGKQNETDVRLLIYIVGGDEGFYTTAVIKGHDVIPIVETSRNHFGPQILELFSS